MKRFFQLFLGLLGCSAGCSRTIDPPAAFTRRYVEIYREKASNVARVNVVKPLHIKVVLKDGHEFEGFLDNAYDAYKNAPADRDQIISRYVSAALDMSPGENHQIDSSRLVGIVKDSAWMAEVKAAIIERGGQKPADHVFDRLNDDLVVVYAEDSPQNIRYLEPADLNKISVRKEDLRKQSGENLLRLLPKCEVQGSNGTFMVIADGSYEASLLAVEPFWTKERFPVTGDIVAAVPCRDLLLVTGSNDKANLAKVRKIVADTYSGAPYRLTPKLFVLRQNKWHAFAE